MWRYVSHLSIGYDGGGGGVDSSRGRRSSKQADALMTSIASSLVATHAWAEAAGEAAREAGAVRVIHHKGRL